MAVNIFIYVHAIPTVQAAIVAINTSLEEGDADSTLETLQNEHLDLSDVNPNNKEYYFKGLWAKKQEKAEVPVHVCIRVYLHMDKGKE